MLRTLREALRLQAQEGASCFGQAFGFYPSTAGAVSEPRSLLLVQVTELLCSLASSRDVQQMEQEVMRAALALGAGSAEVFDCLPALLSPGLQIYPVGDPACPQLWLAVGPVTPAWDPEMGVLLAQFLITALRQAGAVRERERQVDEQRLAGQILREMLPAKPLVADQCHCAGRLEPCAALGGDCYCYLENEQGVSLFLADAVGHGLGSTLLAFECRAAWRALRLTPCSVAEQAFRLNDLLFENTGAERFVACFLGELNFASGCFTYVNCGIGPLFLYEGANVEIKMDVEPPLGLFRHQQSQEHSILLRPGEGILIATDGVLDWNDRQQEFYGEHRVSGFLAKNAGSTPEEFLRGLFESLHYFGGSEGQKDDACALILQYLASTSA